MASIDELLASQRSRVHFDASRYSFPRGGATVLHPSLLRAAVDRGAVVVETDETGTPRTPSLLLKAANERGMLPEPGGDARATFDGAVSGTPVGPSSVTKKKSRRELEKAHKAARKEAKKAAKRAAKGGSRDVSASPMLTPAARRRPRSFGRDGIVANKMGGKLAVKEWRLKERMKTVSVALVLCMNIGVDPPDVMRTSPCARIECWIDPTTMPAQKALESIGKQVQSQYERWQPRARYKQSLDPTMDDVKKLCQSLRRNAKGERVLFHFNGHGVPKPTANGEIWVFNRNFTKYIPLSVYELMMWMGNPSIYVFDCSAAALIISAFSKFAAKRTEEMRSTRAPSPVGGSGSTGGSGTGGGPSSASASAASGKPGMPGGLPGLGIDGQMPNVNDYIILAACGANETLPVNPDLPADVFTACLTTPIIMALKWFCSRSKLTSVSPDLIDKIPGRLTDRRTPLGELNWIFTAITDTIAWNVLPSELFQKLFRQDLLVASLFRNFLLAERIMRSAGCTPVSWPRLPPTFQHDMWQAWDHAADLCLSQLPELIANPDRPFQHSQFFTEQLTAFETWLQFGSERKRAPEQLPIVLQVLLSQGHRQRALELLGDFLDMGPWAVNQALSVGIFPYVLKLLQSPSSELRKIMVLIWAKILALDVSCQVDLVKDAGHVYFISMLTQESINAEEKTLTAFCLAAIMDGYQQGKVACLNHDLLPALVALVRHEDATVRQWVLLCMGKLWEDFPMAKLRAMETRVHELLCSLLTDSVQEVRASAIFALGTLIGEGHSNEQAREMDLNVAHTLVAVAIDGSGLVRKELLVTLGNLVNAYQDEFRRLDQSRQRPRSSMDISSSARSSVNEPSSASEADAGEDFSHQFSHIWVWIASLRDDPFVDVSLAARLIYHQFEAAVARRSSSATDTDVNNSLSTSLLSALSSGLGGSGSVGSHAASDTDEPVLRSPIRRGKALGGKRSAPSSPSRPTRTLRRSGLFSLKRGESSSSLASTMLPGDDGAESSDMSDGGIFDSSTYDADQWIDGDSELLNEVYRMMRPGQPIVASTLYAASCHELNKPRLRDAKAADHTAPEAVERAWRARRNMTVMRNAAAAQKASASAKLDDQVAILDNEGGAATPLLFHPHQPQVVTSDGRSTVTVWDYAKGERYTRFSNLNPAQSTHISSFTLINEDSDSMLLTGTDDGSVRIWRNVFFNAGQEEQVTAWRALPDIKGRPVRGGPGLVVQWQQQNGRLIAAGDSPHIMCWDAQRELCIQGIATETDSCVTSLTDDGSSNKLFIAGTGDGSVLLIDQRLPTGYSIVQRLQAHSSWIVNLALQHRSTTLVSGSVAGDVKIWDIRRLESVHTVSSSTTASIPAPPVTPTRKKSKDKKETIMTALAVHDSAPIFATASRNQNVQVYNLQGNRLSSIRYHDGFLGQRIAPVSALTFHPIEVFLAAGTTDSIVSVYSAEGKREALKQLFS